MIETLDLSVTIGRATILRSVSIDVRAGEVTAILGPNGCGKTTLLRTIAGGIAFTGHVRLLGRELNAIKSAELASLRAVLPQSTPMAFPFTANEVIRLGLMLHPGRADSAFVTTRLEQVLSRVDLAGFGGRFYHELSGGEQQRVQLARVLCQVWDPIVDGQSRLLLLDEPVSSLDIKHQILVMQIAQGFARRGGCVITVLHDLNLASMFCDRAILMRGGNVIRSGAMNDVFSDDHLSAAFACTLRVGAVPSPGKPFVLPHCTVA